jgi:hypothetical protein
MDRLEELKAKYRPVLETIQQGGVRLSGLRLQDNKLLIEAVVPSQDVKNAVWNKIKEVDSTYSDLTCDLKVGLAAAAAASAGSQPGFHQAVQGVSPSSLANGLAAAFRSDQTPPFPSMLSSLFQNSDGQQRAGVLNQLIGTVGPSLGAAGVSGPLAGLLKGGSTVTPEQAERISPEAIQNLAEHAEKIRPSIIDHVSGFYSQHPKVVQALGAGALAMIMSHISKGGKE